MYIPDDVRDKKYKKRATIQKTLDDYMDKYSTQTTLDDFGLEMIYSKKKKKYRQSTLDEF